MIFPPSEEGIYIPSFVMGESTVQSTQANLPTWQVIHFPNRVSQVVLCASMATSLFEQ